MGTTIKDIADLAGVSTATVSRVINSNGFVKDKTRKRISALLEKHNYVIPPIQKRQGPGRSRALNLKYNNFTMIWIGSPTTLTAQGMLFGLSEAAGATGTTLNIDVVSPSGGIPEILNSRKTDGIFLNGNQFPEAFLNKAKSFPVVWLLQAGLQDFGDRVQPDHIQAGLLAYNYFRKRDCKTLCCISCGKTSKYPSYWQTREQAFSNAAKAGNIPCQVINLDYDDNQNSPIAVQSRAATEAVRRIKQMNPRPDGIFIANTLGFPVYSELIANGIVPGRDIELIAGDKEVCGGYCNPEPVTIDIHSKRIGELAFETMIWRLKNPDRPTVTCMLKPSLVIPE